MLLGTIREAEARAKAHMEKSLKYADLQEALAKYYKAKEALLKPAQP
jgi:hypothetical protein